MTAPWPCDECGAPGVRNLGVRGYCARHLTELLSKFGGGVGATPPPVGVQIGALRPEFGPLEAELGCLQCGATWTGRPGDRCGWCDAAAERLVEWRAATLLCPELPDLDDRARDGALVGWAEMLANGVAAGIVTEQQARAALAREEGRRRAA